MCIIAVFYTMNPLHNVNCHKVTIRPKFFGTVQNFKGLFRKKYEVIWDAELSRIPNPVPI